MLQSAEIVIVGGGVIGLSVARAIALCGVKDVLLIERARVGREASFAAAGILAPQAEADTQDIFFELASTSRDLYPTFARALQDETGIDIELDSTGTLFLAFTAEDQEEIEQRYEWQMRAGLAVERLTAAEARKLEPCISENVRSALRFPQDTQVENRLLLDALSNSCRRHSVAIATNTTVKSLKVQHGRVRGVDTSNGFVAAGTVVVAGGAWTSLINGLPDIPIEPVRGQLLCLIGEPRVARHVIYSRRGYLVPRRDGRMLAGSTTERAGFDKAVTDGATQTIRSHAQEISSRAAALPVVDSWAGLRPRAPDNLPVLGPCDEIEGLIYATGHYRNGILLAPITGELIAGAIIQKSFPSLLTAFSADRFGLVAAN